jgi:uncharacterized lipoprotein YajG
MRFTAYFAAIPVAALAGCASPPAGQAVTATSTTAAAPTIPGYRTVVRSGVTLYCRTEAATGSVLGKEQCRTAEQIHQQEESARQTLDDQRRNPTPGRY